MSRLNVATGNRCHQEVDSSEEPSKNWSVSCESSSFIVSVSRVTAALTELILICMFCFITKYFLIYYVHLLGTSKTEQALLSIDAANVACLKKQDQSLPVLQYAQLSVKYPSQHQRIIRCSVPFHSITIQLIYYSK